MTACRRIVFAGKSNVGKSSVINRLLNRKNFARVGSQPGKTIHVNYFNIDGRCWFVDLPGLRLRRRGQGGARPLGQAHGELFRRAGADKPRRHIVDARHKPTADDVTMADWFKNSGRPFVVVANKTDKLSKSAVGEHLAIIRETLELPEEVPLIPFSAEKGDGRPESAGGDNGTALKRAGWTKTSIPLL
ncbi:MAG: ribosome biogenesis GTP-binding protein YihA/YsxC [Oscillospiraceae bacterium]